MTDQNLENANAHDIKRIERRTVRYGFEDGILEIALGVFAVILGLFFLGSGLAPEKSTARFIFDVGFLPVFLAGYWAARKLAQSLKQHLTYPRTGYLAYKRPEKAKRIKRALLAGISAGLIAALATALFTSLPSRFDWVPAFTGLIFGVTLVVLSLRTGLVRVAIAAVLTAAAGVGLSLAGWAPGLELAAFYGAVGVMALISGLLGLRAYLRRNSLPEEGSR